MNTGSVTCSTLLAHLRLLRLVQSLVIVEEEDLDFLFLIRSEERYLMYLDLLQELKPPAGAVPLPPLDVALMWTVHMLAPYRYHEDLLRSYSPHLLNYSFPLERYVASVDIEDPSTDHEAFGPSKEMWQQVYPDEAFDLDKNDTNRMFQIECLWCGEINIMDSTIYIKFRIDGIPIDCGGCGSQCSLETLSSKRLWEGIKAFQSDQTNPKVLLAGSLISPFSGTPDITTAQLEHRHLFFHPRIQFGLDQAEASLNCTWPKVITAFQDMGPDQHYGIRPTTLARIMSSYMGLIEDRLSMDLVAGALRQRDFQKANRYKKFMLLSRADSGNRVPATIPTFEDGTSETIAAADGNLGTTMTSVLGGGGGGQPGRHALVPTLDIDLAWHTHMLSPPHYRQYQLVRYGRVLNHDDTVQATSTMTKQDFVRTAELWQGVYHERYSNQHISLGRFILTPEKLCAGVCFPPYGVYLIWKSWKSKRKAKRLDRDRADDGGIRQNVQMRTDDIDDEDMNEKNGSSSSSARNSIDNARRPAITTTTSTTVTTTTTTTMALIEKNSELQIEELSVAPENEAEGLVESSRGNGYEAKGKGRCEDDDPSNTVAEEESQASTSMEGERMTPTARGSPQSQVSHRKLTPALGLDGRLSNWNGDTAGPDGQASCSSGACIMSPWNELQDLVPYVDMQPQQQRELRRERT
ncbi:hypothetical protein BGX28_000190 [Mortierella sp. GBA30]|nr:hypothetical protein BGX28_000190 [Mortierella sp. GBA30]